MCEIFFAHFRIGFLAGILVKVQYSDSCHSLFLFPFSTFLHVFLHPTHRWGSLTPAQRGLRSPRIRESETEKIRFRRRAFELPSPNEGRGEDEDRSLSSAREISVCLPLHRVYRCRMIRIKIIPLFQSTRISFMTIYLRDGQFYLFPSAYTTK